MSDGDWFADEEARRASEEDLERFLEPERAGLIRALPGIVAAALLVLVIAGLIVLRPTGRDRPDLGEIGISAKVCDADRPNGDDRALRRYDRR
jgi:hypothetical protein